MEDRDILATDLVLCPRQKPVCIGPEGEFFQAPRIDDLGCAYATLEGLLTASPSPRLGQVYCLFDNEEVGSGTRQGALSSFLPDVLARTAEILGMSAQAQRQALAQQPAAQCRQRPCRPSQLYRKGRSGEPALPQRAVWSSSSTPVRNIPPLG